MKILKITSLVLVLVMVTFYSCDKVEPPFTTLGNNNNTKDTVRKVLLEEFTGQSCINCPGAHVIADQLKDLYGKKLIIIASHVGSFAEPSTTDTNFMKDYRTTMGNAIESQFAVSGLPKGMVNRKKLNGSFTFGKDKYGTAISAFLDSLPETPEAYIYLESNFSNSDSTIDVKADVTFLNSTLTSGSYKLCVVITESKIYGAQKNNNAQIGTVPTIFGYEHKHMLRGDVNGNFGEEILNGTPTLNQKISKTYQNYKLGSTWKPENCTIVAYLYYGDGANQWEVIQAQEIQVK